jgi:glucuronate isomerase
LFQKALSGTCTAEEADAFRGHMLTEMARMSLDDGLVHADSRRLSYRNHSAGHLFKAFGRDRGFDIPHPHRLCPRAETDARRGRHAKRN